MAALTFAFRRVALSIGGIVLGSIPFFALSLGSRWMDVDLLVMDDHLSQFEIVLIITLLFAGIAVSANFVLEYLGHWSGIREHGASVIDGVAVTCFYVSLFLVVLSALLSGFMFAMQVSSIRGDMAFVDQFSEQAVLRDVPRFLCAVFLATALGELWLARRVFAQRRMKDYFYE